MLILVLMLAPAEVWRAPINDAVYRGFDSNLLFTSGGGGVVRVSAGSIDMEAASASQPSVNLATTLRRKLETSLDVVVLQNDAADQPLRIGTWSPWTGTGYFIVFGPPPQDLITADTVAKGVPGPTLTGGNVITSTTLGRYQLGNTYRVAVDVDRADGSITVRVSGNDGVDARSSVDSRQFPALFGIVQVSLTVSSSAGAGTTHVVLRNFVLTLPHERSWASRVQDATVTILVVTLAVLGFLAILVSLTTRWRRRMRSPFSRRLRIWWPAIGAVMVYIAGNALLFQLGGHPFDFGNEQLYAYVARSYGTVQLYYLPNVVSLALGGGPYVESAFPYGPVVAYLFTGIGWLNSLLFAGGGTFALGSASLGYLIKSMNVTFGLGDGFLIYLIARQITESRRWSLAASALFLFNPAVWFSMSVWGQTHTVSLFFVLAAVYAAERRLPLWAWLALIAACLTRPQMIVFGILLGIVFLRKFSWTENLSALSWTVILNFVLWIPLTLATSPSLPIDITFNNLYVQEAGGNQAALTTVSQSAYSVWPLITYLVHGANGLQRAFTPSSFFLVGSVTYQLAGQVLTAAAILIVSAGVMFRKQVTAEPGGYMPLVALGITSFLLLLTGIVATHFLLALPFLLVCRRWIGTVAYVYVTAIWTVSTLVPMFGDMGSVISSQQYPLLASDHNAITRFFVGLYTWNRFITVAVVANICAAIWLACLTFRTTPGRRHAPIAAG